MRSHHTQALQALLHFLGLTEPPPWRRVLLVNGRASTGLESWRDRLQITQWHRGLFEELTAAGWRPDSSPPAPGAAQFDAIWLIPDRQRPCQLGEIAACWRLLAPGGTMLTSLPNDLGARRLEENLRSIAPEGAVTSFSKHHCRVNSATKPPSAPPPAVAQILSDWEGGAAMRRAPATGCWSSPGLFSWDRIDPGSALLANTLPPDLSGAVADLGCGWGWLAMEVLRRCENVNSLDCYEVDARALEPARRNLGNVLVPVRPRIHWRDVTSGVGLAKFNAVVMNPPFHEGRDADPSLGIRFIAAAARALRKDGVLWMVANRHLPYEDALADCFATVSPGPSRDGFKVLRATEVLPRMHHQQGRSRPKRR
jgi:16S rRNA (guanine1207-N2)-methyltransferase